MKSHSGKLRTECLTTALPGSPSGPTPSCTAATANGWQPPAATLASTAWSCLVAEKERRKPVRELAETQDAVFAVAFSPDGKRIATAGADRTIRVYETDTGKVLVQIEDHADWIFDIAFSPDGTRLASGSRDKTSKVFDVVKKESLVTFTGHGQPVYTVAFSPDGKAVATGGEDNEIRVWNHGRRGQAGPRDRRVCRRRVQAPLFARRQAARRL